MHCHDRGDNDNTIGLPHISQFYKSNKPITESNKFKWMFRYGVRVILEPREHCCPKKKWMSQEYKQKVFVFAREFHSDRPKLRA
jgi:hypothetical protein